MSFILAKLSTECYSVESYSVESLAKIKLIQFS